ncbi:ADP-ribosyltransferase, partial [Xanthomonas citri]
PTKRLISQEEMWGNLRSWQGMAVEWESNSTTGKRISMFSERPNEQEVLFPPGTRFQVTRIEENETHPRLKIYQSQIA